MGKIIMTADDSASVRQMVNFTLKQNYPITQQAAIDIITTLTFAGLLNYNWN